MKLTEASPRVNGVHVMEAHIDRLSPLYIKMEANYALVQAVKQDLADPNSGYDINTHGKSTAYPTNWSERTLQLLRELIDSMEEDLLPQHFDTEPKEVSDETGTEYRGEEGPAQV